MVNDFCSDKVDVNETETELRKEERKTGTIIDFSPQAEYTNNTHANDPNPKCYILFMKLFTFHLT